MHIMPSSWPPASATSAYSYQSNAAFISVQPRQSFGQVVVDPCPGVLKAVSHPSQQVHRDPTPKPEPATNEVVHSQGPGLLQPPPLRLASPEAAVPSQEPHKKFVWPEAVRRYVQRSFMPAYLEADVSRHEIESKLKELISQSRESGALLTIDWNKMTLPQVLIKVEREAKRRVLLKAERDAESRPLPEKILVSTSAEPPRQQKKRKSSDSVDDERIPPLNPWNTANFRPLTLEDRFSSVVVDKYASSSPQLTKSSKLQKLTDKRQRRLEGGHKSQLRSPSPTPFQAGPVLGTCMSLEKNYLRLTAPPVPSQVRPEHVLRQTLEFLKRRWKTENNYGYICDQFKSLRQDLTVQRIKNEFTVSVYEIHARIALEKGDLGEYNQCQTQLRSFYALGLKGCSVEFKAYRILYFIHTSNRTSLNDTLADLTQAEKEEPAIMHALDVRSALALGNYHRFFQLFDVTPNMGAYIMDMFVDRERLAAICNICKGYKPDVKLRFITEELGFQTDPAAAEFLIDKGADRLLEERSGDIYFLSGKAGSIFESHKNEAFRKVDLKGQI